MYVKFPSVRNDVQQNEQGLCIRRAWTLTTWRTRKAQSCSPRLIYYRGWQPHIRKNIHVFVLACGVGITSKSAVCVQGALLVKLNCLVNSKMDLLICGKIALKMPAFAMR